MIPIHSNKYLLPTLCEIFETTKQGSFGNFMVYSCNKDLYTVANPKNSDPFLFSPYLIDGTFGSFVHYGNLFLFSYGVAEMNKEQYSLYFSNRVALFSFHDCTDSWLASWQLRFPHHRFKPPGFTRRDSFTDFRKASRDAASCMRRLSSYADSFDVIYSKMEKLAKGM